MSDFLTMGGYGSYVWPAYVVAVVVMVGLLVATLRSARSSEKTLDLLQQARGRGRHRRRASAEEPLPSASETPLTQDAPTHDS